MTSYSGSRDDFPEEVVFHQTSAVGGWFLRNTKANGSSQKGLGTEGKGEGTIRQVVKAGRDLKTTLNLDNLPKALVCVW